MNGIFKSSALWQFAGGFVLGAIGLVALHPGDTATIRPAPTPATVAAMR